MCESRKIVDVALIIEVVSDVTLTILLSAWSSAYPIGGRANGKVEIQNNANACGSLNPIRIEYVNPYSLDQVQDVVRRSNSVCNAEFFCWQWK